MKVYRSTDNKTYYYMPTEVIDMMGIDEDKCCTRIDNVYFCGSNIISGLVAFQSHIFVLTQAVSDEVIIQYKLKGLL